MDWNIVLAMIGTGGLTGLVNWLINLKVNQSKARLDQDDIFREMAEKNNQFIAQLINDKEEWQKQCNTLSERFALLERLIVEEVKRCRSYDTCPVRIRLQKYKGDNYLQRNRPPRVGQKGHRHPRDNPVEPGDAAGADRQPP